MILCIILFIKLENIFGNIEIFEIGRYNFFTEERSPFLNIGEIYSVFQVKEKTPDSIIPSCE